MRRALGLMLGLLLVAGGLTLARAQERPFTDADDPARLRAELLALRKEMRDLKARLAHLEQIMATVAAQTSDTTKPALDANLGFVVPNMPRGSDYGASQSSDLARAVHHAATSGEHDVEKYLAFNRDDFYVPESLWNQAAKGLKTLRGLPTHAELDLALASLRGAGVGSQVLNIRGVPDLVPEVSRRYVQVVDLIVSVESRTETYRFTTVYLGGRWFVAHLLALGAEDDARAFLEDLIASQKAFNAWKQGKYFARNLHELAAARDLEKNPSVKLAGLTFPVGARFDRLEKDKLEWDGNDLRGPFYRLSLVGDEKSWSAVATPRTSSYATFSVNVAAGADPSRKPEIKRSGVDSDASRRREGERDGD